MIWNNFKTALLMAAMMGLCLGFAHVLGVPVWYGLILGGVINVVAFFFSDRIALATMRAQPVDPRRDPQLYQMVHRLAERANLPAPAVYMSPAAAPNAFATGRSPRHSAVCVTAGLRQMLTEDELAGVIAHELAHIRHRDTLISTVAAIAAGAISYLAYIGLFFGGGDRRSPLVGLLMFIFAPIAAGLIQAAISRSREYEADRLGAQIAGSPGALASALEKLSRASRRTPLPVSDAQTNLFIVQPFTGREMARWFMTHPPIKRRVARLRAMD